MRNKILYFIIIYCVCFSFQTHAQDSVVDRFYVSVGLDFWSPININEPLARAGMLQVGHFLPEIGIGESIHHKGFYYIYGLSAFFNGKKSSQNSYKLSGASIYLNPQYKILKIGKQRLYAGAILAFRTTGLTLYAKNSIVDFDKTLNPAKNKDAIIQLYHNDFLLGPTISTGNLFPTSGFLLSVALSYEFNVIRGRWKSRFIDVLHSPKGQANQLKISLLIAL